jgi:alpha-glucosidase (family GH31 glycosyl hydrolase)
VRATITVLALVSVCATARVLSAQPISTAGQPAQLDVRAAGDHSLRVTLKPLTFRGDFPQTPAVVDRAYPAPALSIRDLTTPLTKRVAGMDLEVKAAPLTLIVRRAGRVIQQLVFETDGSVSFRLDDQPVLGMGEGGPRPAPGRPWREQPVQFDRRGQLDTMEPRWQSDMYGSRNPVAMLLGTSGWGLFVATPWMQVDLRDPSRGRFIPAMTTPSDAAPQTERNQQQALGKGLPPADRVVTGLVDLFVFDAADPPAALRDFSRITGPAALPPKWALGYMQSHRTLENEAQILGIVDRFREKQLPLDAVIYLGTGFAPRGWNTKQPSFDFNPDVFTRDPAAVLADMHARQVKVVVHMVPWDRDRLPTLHGTIPPLPGETIDQAHIQSYWQQHLGLVKAGVDAFWPDEGDWFNLFERIKRHQLYYQGELSAKPNVRPWSLQRNGYPGIAQWGGWVWSGDTESSWKTLEAQIAVGLNYSLSIGPYWGSDIGGFYANSELDGELYARWFQFAAFCGSFRSHGRTWWTRLPWGWGLPLMRALWLHYPADPQARRTGDEYLWGRDLLIAPVYTKGATARDVYLPAGEWYDWWTGARTSGGRTVSRQVDLATMPIYVRAGAIVPIDPIRQYTSQPVTEPTTLRVYPGADGSTTLYEDDGISQEYLAGKGTWIAMTWNDRTRQLTLAPSAPAGATNVLTERRFKVTVPGGETKDVTYSGRRVRLTM